MTETINLEIIKAAGLSDLQASIYLYLIENGQNTPTQLATALQENRPTIYAALEKLVKFNLITQKDKGKIAAYIANHPSHLETLIEARRKTILKKERLIKDNLAPLLTAFYTHSEQPGTKIIEGLAGVKEVFTDILRVKANVYFLRAGDTSDHTNLAQISPDFLIKHRRQRAQLKINTYAIATFGPQSQLHLANNLDKEMLYHRITIPKHLYNLPVQLNVYGHKVALTVFGETQQTIIIDNAMIAQMMKWTLINLGASFAKEYKQYSDTSNWAIKQLN